MREVTKMHVLKVGDVAERADVSVQLEDIDGRIRALRSLRGALVPNGMRARRPRRPTRAGGVRPPSWSTATTWRTGRRARERPAAASTPKERDPPAARPLSSAGLGALLETAYLLPLTVAFLALALGSLAFRGGGAGAGLTVRSG